MSKAMNFQIVVETEYSFKKLCQVLTVFDFCRFTPKENVGLDDPFYAIRIMKNFLDFVYRGFDGEPKLMDEPMAHQWVSQYKLCEDVFNMIKNKDGVLMTEGLTRVEIHLHPGNYTHFYRSMHTLIECLDMVGFDFTINLIGGNKNEDYSRKIRDSVPKSRQSVHKTTHLQSSGNRRKNVLCERREHD